MSPSDMRNSACTHHFPFPALIRWPFEPAHVMYGLLGCQSVGWTHEMVHAHTVSLSWPSFAHPLSMHTLCMGSCGVRQSVVYVEWRVYAPCCVHSSLRHALLSMCASIVCPLCTDTMG